MHRVGLTVLAVIFAISVVFVEFSPLVHAAEPTIFTSCMVTNSICIMEVGTMGAAGSEDEDFVAVANTSATPVSITNLQLQYVTTSGVIDSKVSLGSFAAGQVKYYVSDSLAEVNPSASKLSPIALASSGGSLQIVKATSSTVAAPTTIYDRLSWGAGQPTEGNPLAVHGSGSTYIREQAGGSYQDTNDNSLDFAATTLGCRGAAINEIQPFTSNTTGEATDAWVELFGISDKAGDCLLLSGAGGSYTISADDLPDKDSLTVISRGTDGANEVPLYIGERSGQVWVAGLGGFGGASGVRLPYDKQSYSNLAKGQSWVKIENHWQRTYALTPAAGNIYQKDPLVIDADPQACEAVRITELLPNPTGTDTDNEWVEVHNESQQSVALGRCLVNIGGTIYNFLADDGLAPDEWRAVSSLYTPEGDDKQVSLRNSGDTLVALQRLDQDGVTAATIQSFTYSDPPEGETWARFDDGWHWSFAMTPNEPNVLQEIAPVPEVTEYAAGQQSGDTDVQTSASANGAPIAGTANILITELLPNPATPLTDEDDEFVELYNPTGESVDLYGYKLQTGNTYSYSQTFGHITIPAGAHHAFYSSETSVSLSNSSGKARLLAPDGTVISETTSYEKAPEGAAWAYENGGWQWTSTATPSAVNIITAQLVFPTTKTASSKSTKASVAKTAGASTKAATAKKASADKSLAAAPDGDEAGPAALHPSILAGVGVITVAYGLYEYRHDLANRLYQFRRYRAARRAARGKA